MIYVYVKPEVINTIYFVNDNDRHIELKISANTYTSIQRFLKELSCDVKCPCHFEMFSDTICTFVLDNKIGLSIYNEDAFTIANTMILLNESKAMYFNHYQNDDEIGEAGEDGAGEADALIDSGD